MHIELIDAGGLALLHSTRPMIRVPFDPVVSNPTAANPDYNLVTWRSPGRTLKFGARVSF